MLVDSHCHLEFPEFEADLDETLARAKEAGIELMQSIGTRISHFPRILALAEKYPQIYCSYGIHPHEADKEIVSAEEIIEFTKHPKVIGIGETGLDFYYEHSSRPNQIESFRQHIKAARSTGLPIIVHTRDADDTTIQILEEEMKIGQFKGLIHCFTASKEFAERAMAIGFYISISGIVTFKKAEDLQNIVKDLPLDRLLVETDAPFLAPIPYRGKRNEPAYTRHTAEFIANLKGLSFEEVAKATTDNFYHLFDKVKRT